MISKKISRRFRPSPMDYTLWPLVSHIHPSQSAPNQDLVLVTQYTFNQNNNPLYPCAEIFIYRPKFGSNLLIFFIRVNSFEFSVDFQAVPDIKSGKSPIEVLNASLAELLANQFVDHTQGLKQLQEEGIYGRLIH